MVQWCKNRVIFYADRETRNILARLFKGLAESEQKEANGQLPPFAKKWEHRFRNIKWSEDEEVAYYDTRHLPNIDELVELADFYRCAFECTYTLPDGKFCRAFYRDGILTGQSETNPIPPSREIRVIDLDGMEKIVTDLDRAIALTAQFMDYRHTDKSFVEFDEKMRRYWTDLNDKLTSIKNNNDTH